jgi:hypothetical protein
MRIVQFFIEHNLRGGERQLSIDVAGENAKLPQGDFFFFLNKKRNIVKVLGARGVYTEHLPENETFDFKLRLKEFLRKVGVFFNLNLYTTPEVIDKLAEIIKEKGVKKDAKQSTEKRVPVRNRGKSKVRG